MQEENNDALEQPTESSKTEGSKIDRTVPIGSLQGQSLAEGVAGRHHLLDVLAQENVATPVVLPRRGLRSSLIAGVIAGFLGALVNIILVLSNAGTFHDAHLQIVADSLTVKVALVLAGIGSLTILILVMIGFFTGFVVGKIAVRRAFGFLAGVVAGIIFSLVTLLISFIPSYSGNLFASTNSGVLLPILFLCLWGIGGGLVGLFGTWTSTQRHPHYMGRRK